MLTDVNAFVVVSPVPFRHKCWRYYTHTHISVVHSLRMHCTIYTYYPYTSSTQYDGTGCILYAASVLCVLCVWTPIFFFAMPLSLKERWRRQWMEMNPFICHLWIVEAVKKKMCEVFVLKSAEHIWYSYFPPDETKEIFRKRERKRGKSKMRETTSIANHTRQHIQYKY